MSIKRLHFFSHENKIFIKLALICIPKIWSELWIWKNEFTTNNNNWNSICIKNLFLSYFSFFHVRCVNWERNNKPYSIYGYIIEINVLNGEKGLYLTWSRQRVICVAAISAGRFSCQFRMQFSISRKQCCFYYVWNYPHL